LVIGDIVGKPGRKILKEKLGELKANFSPQAVIVNGENAAGGFGLTPPVCEEILSLGVDVVTSGNHIWDKKEVIPYLDEQSCLLRPLNYPPTVPGRGTVVMTTNRIQWAVINLSGRVFMPTLDCPFQRIEQELKNVREVTPIILIDFHAEATSEKIALGRFLDGRVSCVFGTHTHVATADSQILPGGTAYITDLGMTGSQDSVIGMEIEGILHRFLTQMPTKFKVARGNCWLNGIVLEVDDATGKATDIIQVSVS